MYISNYWNFVVSQVKKKETREIEIDKLLLICLWLIDTKLVQMKLVAATRLKISTATPLSAYNQGKPDLSRDTPTQHCQDILLYLTTAVIYQKTSDMLPFNSPDGAASLSPHRNS